MLSSCRFTSLSIRVIEKKIVNDCHIRAKAVGYDFDFVRDNPGNQLEGTENGILSFFNCIDQFLEVFLIAIEALNQYPERLAIGRIPQEIIDGPHIFGCIAKAYWEFGPSLEWVRS